MLPTRRSDWPIEIQSLLNDLGRLQTAMIVSHSLFTHSDHL